MDTGARAELRAHMGIRNRMVDGGAGASSDSYGNAKGAMQKGVDPVGAVIEAGAVVSDVVIILEAFCPLYVD